MVECSDKNGPNVASGTGDTSSLKESTHFVDVLNVLNKHFTPLPLLKCLKWMAPKGK